MAEVGSAATSPPVQPPGSGRALAPDLLKGLIMIVMALDHVRSFFMKYDGVKEVWFKEATYNPDFWDFTARYVSHLAAPGFFFMMGMGMVLFSLSRQGAGWDTARIRNSFLIRGALLVVIQITLENSAWAIISNNPSRRLSSGVLGTLGFAMMLTALSLQMRGWILAAVAAACLVLPTFYILSLEGQKGAGLVMTMLLVPDRWDPEGWVAIRSNYPIVQWYGVTVLGVLFGRYWARDREKAYRGCLIVGLALIALFFVMREFDGFWNLRAQVDDSWYAFLQANKYPPSLSWLALTLGGNGIILWAFSRGEEGVRKAAPFLLAYGRSSLAFYVLHLHLYCYMALLLYNEVTGLTRHRDIVSLAAVWWIVGLAILWPLTKWYGAFKRSKPPESVWRFF